MNIASIIAVISEAIDMVPRLTLLGANVAPFIIKAKKAVEDLGSQVSPDDQAFVEMRQKLKDLEGSFQGAVAEHERLIAEAGKTD